ncbi:MAG: (2Fe-2S)-binding protein [Candidatus Aminicenantes bacterium]|nr:MAG: (2Fe-2S)-binding protein [Candidatus Aminicenantes bacterium]
MKEIIQFTLNHKPVRLTVDKDRMLLWVLRTELGLTGPKYGCGEGFCGACTVLVNHSAVRSCQFPIADVKGKEVLTIEGLAKNGKLHPLQTAFMEHNALQCGFCTPGMILNAYSLLKKNPWPTVPDIVRAMEGNLCRCSSYNRIIEAIQTASRSMAGGIS